MSFQNNQLLQELKQKLEAQKPTNKPSTNNSVAKKKSSPANTNPSKTNPAKTNKATKPARSFVPEVVYNPEESLFNFYQQVLQLNNLAETSPSFLAEENWPLLDPENLEREDLTRLNFFTIDSISSQDLDDAICIETTPTGWLLHIALADPAAYLAKASPQDIDAKQRGSSFYLPGQVIHLLPNQLSSGMASLLAGQRRPALVIEVAINKQGEVEDKAKFKLAWVESQAKLDYRSVANWLEDPNSENASPDLATSLQALADFAVARQDWRKKHQLVNSNQPDFRFIVNDLGQLLDLKVEEKNPAHSLIEEAMLLANQLGAEFLAEEVKAGVFTSYPGIKEKNLTAAEELLNQAGITSVSQEELTSLEGYLRLQEELAKLNNPWLITRLKRLNENLSLSLNPELHLGLGVNCYASITAPLRRYQDLINLRLIKAHLIGEPLNLPTSLEIEQLNNLRHKQRRAETLIKNQLYALYLANQLGEKFTGVIYNVNKGGVRINLKENGANAFVPLSLLLPKNQHKTPNPEEGWIEVNEQPLYKLGEEITVEINQINLEQVSVIAKQVQ